MLSHFSRVWFFVTPWTVTFQAPLSMGFTRQEYWSGLPCPPPGDLPNAGIEPVSLTLPPLASRFFTTSTTWEAQFSEYYLFKHVSSKAVTLSVFDRDMQSILAFSKTLLRYVAEPEVRWCRGPWRQHGSSLPERIRVDNKETVCLCHTDYGPWLSRKILLK